MIGCETLKVHIAANSFRSLVNKVQVLVQAMSVLQYSLMGVSLSIWRRSYVPLFRDNRRRSRSEESYLDYRLY